MPSMSNSQWPQDRHCRQYLADPHLKASACAGRAWCRRAPSAAFARSRACAARWSANGHGQGTGSTRSSMPRVSGILSDLFGANGMRILKGLGRERAARDDPGLADQPCDVLTACSLFLLRDQLDAFDDATRGLERYDEVINDGLAEHQDQFDLMMTIPGINRAVPSSSRWDPTSPCSPHDAGLPRGRACIPATTKAPANGDRAEPGAATPHCARSSSNVPRVPHGPGTVSSRATTRAWPSAEATARPASPPQMLRVIYSVLKSAVSYHDPDYEAAMVQRNAQRWITMLKKYGIDPATWSSRTRTVA